MELIKDIRKKLGLTQQGFADVAGVTQATVSRWEDGKWQPKLVEVARIRSYAIQHGFEWDDSVFFIETEGNANETHTAA